MPRFIDVSGGRVRLIKELAREQEGFPIPPRLRKGLEELYLGNRHLIVPLGELATTDAAYELTSQPLNELRLSCAFALFLAAEKPVPGTELFQPAKFGPDSINYNAVWARYIMEVDDLAPDSFAPSPRHTNPIRAYGGVLVTAVTTIACPDVVDSQFDAPYVPKAWLDMPSGNMPADYQAVRAAAAYAMMGMTEENYEPN